MLNLFKIGEGLETDSYWQLRAQVELAERTRVVLRFTGASWFELALNGDFIEEGPHRTPECAIEYQSVEFHLEPGLHVFAVLLHYEGVTTRLMEADVEPFFAYACELAGKSHALEWRIQKCEAFRRTGRRIGCVLGWSEWVDTRLLAKNWKLADFDDSDWTLMLPEVDLLKSTPINMAEMQRHRCRCEVIEQGNLAPMSMYDHDPAMSFAIRDLNPTEIPVGGLWWRYDLGRVQLGHVDFELDLPAGALVQVAYAESLTQGRVVPYLKSGGGTDSCPLDTFVAQGGRQKFRPMKPKGARYIELHVLANAASIRMHAFDFVERCYYPVSSEGSFETSDPLLNRIWQVGVDTLRSCAEDVITDNPSRERGQWLGDVVGPGMDILSVAYSDLRPLARGLRQAAQCAREDGLIPAVYPGTREYLPSFSIQWVSALPQYYKLGGDLAMLKELYPAACKNINFFEPYRVRGGLRRNPDLWNFVDWGYQGSASVFLDNSPQDVSMDPALSFFYLKALKSLSWWAERIGQHEDVASYDAKYQTLLEELKQTSLSQFSPDMGFHSAALALGQGLFTDSDCERCVEFLQEHIESCFPNNLSAPRLSDTRVESTQLITPFFMHFVLPVLAENGAIEFVIEQFRSCWGWMLDQGVTTWFEVFDTRWSHCHQWSGCPTWIMSRYILGLQPRFDLGERVYHFRPMAGGMSYAKGTYPTSSGALIDLSWKLQDDGVFQCSIRTTENIRLQLADGRELLVNGELDFEYHQGAVVLDTTVV
ncbi:family 78 glycoside hydrolase catalytic domain [Coraliomargarita sp. SDUM461004]|uniref:Family 78 glycoside hydrolase catalytic domain n=1 Tax=Thalassobacterium sedimentorum TaxID=3041258 RepID=A0ABU1AFY5_9BACT|nr:family 78 glycoside hydrolase catalytic domain [Coraliomargarita sp. SDUM461004]MDQ8193695.1 family 78 glycoside hydrolase catalytic domain [Coraliomargarita sp. SDUM461004]